MDEQQLSKKERIALKHEQERQMFVKQERIKKIRNFGIIAVIIVLVGWGAWWVITESAKPLPGTVFEDQGREHVTDISKVQYNSTPPTSGNHFALWAKRGVYSNMLSDGYLIHSLEHGYIVISYNCSTPEASKNEAALLKDPSLQNLAQAPVGNMSPFTPDTMPPTAVELPESFSSDACKKLVTDLSTYLNEYDRIVIVPRPGLDTQIALTAWTRQLKLQQIDDAAIREFIESYHNKGPEQTIE